MVYIRTVTRYTYIKTHHIISAHRRFMKVSLLEHNTSPSFLTYISFSLKAIYGSYAYLFHYKALINIDFIRERAYNKCDRERK